MAVQAMKKIRLCGWQSSREQILELLQRRGTVEVSSQPADPYFQRMDAAELCRAMEATAAQAEAALEILDIHAPEQKGLLSALEGKRQISPEAYEENAGRLEEIRETAGAIREDQQKLEEVRAEKLRLAAEEESLQPWLGLDVSLAEKGTGHTDVLIGTLPGLWTREQILEELCRAAPEADHFELEVPGSAADQTCLFLLCLKTEREQLEAALRKKGFAGPAVSVDGIPAEHREHLEKLKNRARQREGQILAHLSGMAGRREDLRFLSDYAAMQAERYRIMDRLLQSPHVFYLSGYVPEPCAEPLKQELETGFCCAVELEAPGPEEEVPVLLKNGAFAEPVEDVVGSYGLPGRGELDPSTVMAVFYYFFFGLMLSDAGYGLVMTAGCLIALKKFPGMGAGIRRMLTMFLYCGISTTIWGILFGGYFGDVIPIAAETFFHREVTVPALWFAPLDDPMRLLLFSLLFGLIHLFAGLAVKAYLLLREKKYMDCLCETGFWYMLLAGLILMLLPSGMFASMAGTSIEFPGWLDLLAKLLAAAGAAGILFLAGRRKKNFGLRLALGAYELYGVTSWLSDLLSYSRLLALGIATGVIASVINTMAAMAGGGILGAVIFAVVFLAGHTLNLAINLLGAYVHTNRLQYVEFFGKFYEGNGRAFHPFSAGASQYFDVKEEN